MKTIIHFVFLLLFLMSGTIYSQIEKVILETYYISDSLDSTDTDGGKLDTGSVTYRIYVDLKPGNKLRKIYGDSNHVLKFSSTAPFFNNVDGQTYGMNMRKGNLGANTLALDTWLTLGQATKMQNGKTYFGILKYQDSDGSFIGGANNDGGSDAISGGLLTNTVTAMGIPLTTADGMANLVTPPTAWSYYGVLDFSSGNDTTMFGSMVPRSAFTSTNVFLQNSGVSGVIPDSNQILIAQLTTKGKLAFELNIEVEQLVDTVLTLVKYVANDSILRSGEKKNSFLKYPFPPPVCGCRDPNFLEFNANFECGDSTLCLSRIVFGCMDTMACNYDPGVNFSIPSLCCYPGLCDGRDISVVCPVVNGDSFQCDVYPNPAQSSIFINVTGGIDHSITCSIYNYFGTLVLSKDLGVNQRVINQEINISNLSNGLYLLKINIGNDFVYKQLVKN